MNTIKTLVVITTLLAVGYGAHVVLNKPIPNGQFAQDGGFPTSSAEFGKPSLQMDSEGPTVTLPPLATNDSPSAMPSSGTDAPYALPPLSGQTNVPNRFAQAQVGGQLPATPGQRLTPLTNEATRKAADIQNRFANQGHPRATELSDSADDAMSQLSATANETIERPGVSQEMIQSAPESFSGLANQAESTIARAGGPMSGSTGNPMQHIPTGVGNAGPAVETTSATASRHFGSSGRFEEVWSSAHSKLENGQLVDALLTMSMFFNDTSLTVPQRDQLVPLLDQLAGSVIYSNNVHIEAPYVVQPGETLESVANSYAVAPSYIMRTNGLSSPILQPGQQLKVVRGPFRGELSLSRRELTLFVGRYYAGRFPVAVGRDLPPQASVLDVIEMSGPRPYSDPRTGEQIAAADANNPYGNLWIGLRDSSSPAFSSLGIHSSGSSVDASDSRGCISLSEPDVDDLQAILAIGSRIQIVP